MAQFVGTFRGPDFTVRSVIVSLYIPLTRTQYIRTVTLHSVDAYVLPQRCPTPSTVQTALHCPVLYSLSRNDSTSCGLEAGEGKIPVPIPRYVVTTVRTVLSFFPSALLFLSHLPSFVAALHRYVGSSHPGRVRMFCRRVVELNAISLSLLPSHDGGVKRG